MPSVYRTAQGKMVDLDKLIHKNEMTLAVGNMRVNARGDKINSSNTYLPPDQNLKQQVRQSQIVPENTPQVEAKKAESAKQKTAKSEE